MAINREFFILGEDWSLYEELVPVENFTVEEILAIECTKYHFTDEKGRYCIRPCPVSVRERGIRLKDLETQFSPQLVLANSVVSCEETSSPDFEVPNAFALVSESVSGRCYNAIYGKQDEGIVLELYAAGLRPLSDFAKEFSTQLSQFCKKYELLLLLHNEYVLNVQDPNQLLNAKNEPYA